MSDAKEEIDPATGWLLFLPQLPAKPAYARVKIWRRLAEIGAVAVKNAAHMLPNTPQAREDFEWLLREVLASGGEGMICEARLLDGLSDADVHDLFNAARNQDYAALGDEIRGALNQIRKALTADERIEVTARLKRWRRRLSAIVDIDFHGALGRRSAEELMAQMEATLQKPKTMNTASAPLLPRETLGGRVWVTRQGVKVDRIACAWLIRRFIDSKARFKFVPGQGYIPAPGELRFDMFDAEFTHEGDRCSFEVLTARTGLTDPALQPLGEIVHDIDLKDGKFGRAEAPGIASVLEGIAAANPDDEHRLARGAAVFDDLYANFHRARA